MRHNPLRPESDDIYRPRPMIEPRMLFRSMAVGELIGIVRTGTVTGGGCVFHLGEDRPYVFFGGDLNEFLLANGESLDRRVIFELRDHDIHAELAAARAVVRLRSKAILRRMRLAGIRHTGADRAAFRSGTNPVPLARVLSTSVTSERPKWAKLLRGYAGALRTYRRLDAAHYALLRNHLSELARRAVNQPYTSAVIVTYPMTGGLEYRDEFGGTLNRGEPEYCFPPGHITLRDIMEVLLVKSGAIVQRIAPGSFSHIELLCRSAMAVEAAEEATLAWEGPVGERLTVRCHRTRELTWSAKGGAGVFAWRMPWVFYARSGSL